MLKTENFSSQWIRMLFLSLFIFCIQCNAAEFEGINSKKAFYAISSLYHHLEEITSPVSSNEDEEQILFDDEDVSLLWESASSNPAIFPEVDLAQQYYYLAHEKKDNPIAAGEYYIKSKQVVSDIWNNLDIFHQKINSTAKIQEEFDLEILNESYPNFDNNLLINKDAREIIKPYLLPLVHPIKKPLDLIFSQSRAIENETTFANAGFITLFAMPYSFIRVARHPDLPGYLLKVYLDSETRKKKNRPGWLSLTRRCMGAENIRRLIEEEKIIYFTIPDKWVYVLPEYPKPKLISGQSPQLLVLVVTDMNLVSKEKTIEAWQYKITHKHLDELYCIISHGYGSSGLIRNVPYTKSGKFAFVDTESPIKTPMYAKAKRHFSKEMKAYWDLLVKTGGNPKK